MIAGFACTAGGDARQLDPAEAQAGIVGQDPVMVWLDLESPTHEELAQIGARYALHPEALEDCISGEQRPRIDEFDDMLFLVLYGAVGPEDELAFDPRKLAIFFNERVLITVEREPLRTVRGIRERFRKDPRLLLGRGTNYVLYHIIDTMTDNCLLLADRYQARVDSLEEQSMRSDVDESVLVAVAALRDELLTLRQLAVSQRELLIPVARGEYEGISESLEQRFSHVRDHISQLIDALDALREQVRAVRENYHTAVATRTNDIMKALTLLATIMLPMSLIAGIYGMNVPLWPSPEHPQAFWVVMGMMLAVCVVAVYFFKRKHWL